MLRSFAKSNSMGNTMARAIVLQVSCKFAWVCVRRTTNMLSHRNLICVPIGSKLLIVLGAEGFAAFFGALLVMSAIFLSLARWAVLSYSWNWMAKV